MNIYDFIKDLKLRKIVKQKHMKYIDNIAIYIRDLKVYKVVIFANPLMWKKASKSGMKHMINIIYNGFNKDTLKLNLESDTNQDYNHGYWLLMYDPSTANCSIYEGEISVDEQFKNISNIRRTRNVE